MLKLGKRFNIGGLVPGIFGRVGIAQREYQIANNPTQANTVRECVGSKDIKDILQGCDSNRLDQVEVLERLSKESVQTQENVLSKLSESNGNTWLKTNLKLQRLLNDSNVNAHDSAKCLNHILENINSPLSHDLIEIFICRNLDKDNLPAMIMLLQLLFQYQKDFTLSNELWSLYVSLTCENTSIDGAKFIYHNLIDNYRLFENDYSPYNKTQTFLPFLLSPESIASLALIFQREKLPDYIIGLREYFKRFYSLYGHRTCLKTVSISLVEAFSEALDVVNALSAFRYLCIMFKDHKNFKPHEQFLETAYSMMVHSSSWRVSNLQSNQSRFPSWPDELKSDLDKVQELYLEGHNRTIYNPIDSKSNTTRMVPTLNGSLRLNDLPMFSKLIDKVVVSHMNSNTHNKVNNLIKLIENNHFMLNAFIISALSSNGYLYEAFAVMKKTQPKYLDHMLPVLFKEDLFVVLLQQCKVQLNTLNSDEIVNFQALKDLNQLITDIIKFYFKAYGIAEITIESSKVLAAYISLVIDTPRFQSSLIEGYLDRYMKRTNQKIYLSPGDFNKLNELYDLENSRHKEIIFPKYL